MMAAYRADHVPDPGLGSASPGSLILLIVLLVSMAITALYGWTVERIAYRPLRIVPPCTNAVCDRHVFVTDQLSQIAQGARVKPVAADHHRRYTLVSGGRFVSGCDVQIIVVITPSCCCGVSPAVAKTRLGPRHARMEQDQTMAALLGVDSTRTISMTS